MKIIKCPSCGTLISEGLNMCPRCGAQIKTTSEPASPSKQEEPVSEKKEKKEKKKNAGHEWKLSTKVLLTSILFILLSVGMKVLAYVLGAKTPAENPGSIWLKVDFFFSVFLVFSLLPLPLLIKGWWKKIVGLLLVLGLGALWVIHCINLYTGILWTVEIF